MYWRHEYVGSTQMCIFSLSSFIELGKTSEYLKWTKDCELLPQASFPHYSIYQISACGSDIMLASCFSMLAGNMSGPEISNSFIAVVESMFPSLALSGYLSLASHLTLSLK